MVNDCLHTPFNPDLWSGRSDGPGPLHARWHSVIGPVADTPGIAVLGFASDEGVARNGGRVGAAQGPAALRGALSSLAIHDDRPRYDAGTITTRGTDLESAQQAVTDTVAQLVTAGHTVVCLGGGHETAWATHRGLHAATDGRSCAIINLDAHFDLREASRATSGTPFLQIAGLRGADFDYHVLGISRPNNTAVLFETAASLGVHTVTDEELLELSASAAGELVTRAAAHADVVHLSIDLDGLPAAVAPGVSAPAGLGVPLTHYRAMARAAAASGKLALVDVVELNPLFDVDARTARVAARLIDDIITALPA